MGLAEHSCPVAREPRKIPCFPWVSPEAAGMALAMVQTCHSSTDPHATFVFDLKRDLPDDIHARL
jgi:hypothetical protein